MYRSARSTFRHGISGSVKCRQNSAPRINQVKKTDLPGLTGLNLSKALLSSSCHLDTLQAQSYNSSKYNATLRTNWSLNHSFRFCSGSCDERKDIDNTSSSLSANEEGRGRNEQAEKTDDAKESKKDCNDELSSESKEKPTSSKEDVTGDQEAPKQDTSKKSKSQPKDKKRGSGKTNPLKNKFKKMIIGWEKIDDTFESFPYYLNEHTKDLLVESGAAQLWHHKQTKFGKSLRNSSHLILLTGPPDTEIYQEKLVRALAQHLQTPLLILDSNDLASQYFKHDSPESQCECGDETNTQDETELWAISSADDETQNDEDEPSNKKILPAEKFVQTLGQIVRFDDKPSRGSRASKLVHEEDDDDDSDEESHADVIRIGDRVRFIGGQDAKMTKKRSSLRVGQQGLVASISDTFPTKIGVKFETVSSKKSSTSSRKSSGSVTLCDVKELEKVDGKYQEREPWMTSIEAFSELGATAGGLIIYFPDLQKWMAKAVPRDERNLFLHTLTDFLENSKGPVLFIAGRRKEVTPVNNATAAGQWHPLKSLFSQMRGASIRKIKIPLRGGEADMKGTEEVFEIFRNVVPVFPPQDQEQLRQWREQLDQDKKQIRSWNNLKEIEKVLIENGMECADIADLDTSDLVLTEKQAQKIVGWARNICLNASPIQQKGNTLFLPVQSLELAVSRFRAIEKTATDRSNDIKALAENDYETELASSVVRAKDIGVSFEQIGALENVKNTLEELIILPLKRPELFRKGNLRKPVKGVLLFGPPGTGKTLLAKAVATEAGANFMSISSSNINSKWFGDAEKLAKSIFTLAKKLEPTIIFIDEVDGILRARGDSSEHEASRRVRNELMAAWDGLQSKDSDRIIVLATTNRPFDLDDAVIRRLPRRIFIDLPDLYNREKILRVLLADEDLSNNFDFMQLAAQTEGFSGSDLKNLCVAAAYRPIQEYLEAERVGKVDKHISGSNQRADAVALRSLSLDDFVQAKIKVGTSVAYDASSMVQIRHWNEQYGEGGSRTKSVFGFIK